MKKRRRFKEFMIFAVLSMALVLAGCSSNSSGGSSAAVTETMASNSVSSNQELMEEAVSQDTVSGLGNGAEYEMEYGTESSDASDGGSETAALPEGRKLIRTVRLEMETDAFDTALADINKKISSMGGYTEQSEVSGKRQNYSGEAIPRYGNLTIRIPSQNLDAFLQEAAASGNVVSRAESVEDVTLQYTDVESRKKSLEIEQERIWALLEQADSLESMIALEERLSEIRYELESLESRLRLYDNQVDYSTVYLYLREVAENQLTPQSPLTTSQKIGRDFSNNLAAMGQFLLNFMIGLLTLAPFWLPFLLLALLIVWLIRKKTRRQSGTSGAKFPGAGISQNTDGSFPSEPKDGQSSK